MKTDNLQNEVRDYLDITWDDKGTERKLNGIIERGKCKIIDLTDSSDFDFSKNSEAKRLLFEYCRLAWAGVPEKFDELFKSDIIGLRLTNITGGTE